MKKPYTVILLRPDYATDNYGEDTYTAHVEATDIDKAVREAQQEVCCKVDGNDSKECGNYLCIGLFKGHHKNLAGQVQP